MGEIRFVGTGETRGYPYPVCKKRIVGPGKTRGYPYPVCKNTLSYSSPDLSQTKAVVEAESENIIQWYAFNNMQANPEKFQAIILGRKAYSGFKSFRVSDTGIKCEESVKLLGVTVDYEFIYHDTITNFNPFFRCLSAAYMHEKWQKFRD